MLILQGHTAAVRCLGFSPDGRLLASGGDDLTVRLWDMTARAERACCWHGGHVYSLAVTHTGELVASAGMAASVKLWAVPSGARFRANQPFLTSAVLSLPVSVAASGGDLLACCLDGTARLRRLASGRETIVPGSAHVAVFRPGGDVLALVNQQGQVRLWDLEAATERAVLETPNVVLATAFSPDGRSLAVGEREGTVALWDLPRRLRMPVQGSHPAPVSSVAFAPDGRTLASAGEDGVVRFWDVASGDERAAFDWRIGKVHAVAFAPDGMTVAAAGASPNIVVWDVEDW